MPTSEQLQGIHRLRLWYELSSPLDREYGMTAYDMYARDICLVGHSFAPLQQRIAAFALLSPNNDYGGNLRSLRIVLEGYKSRLPIEKLHGLTTYHACARRAYRVLQGESIESVFSPNAKKTYNFYQNIWDPENPQYVTIDGHMYNLWHGERNLLKVAAVKFKPKEYDEISVGFKVAAGELKILPNQLQGTLWWCYKRMLGIRFDYQMDLELVEDGYENGL